MSFQMAEKQSMISSSESDQPQSKQRQYILNLPRDSLEPQTYQWFSLGHVFNDLGGSLYFNYLFFFLKRVVNTPAASAVFLAGQFTDGIFTPLLGYLCDKYGSKKYGQRTPWYCGGNMIFTLGYCFIYLNIHSIFGNTSIGFQYFYYITANLLTNLGWCAVQIANMSLIPTLSFSRVSRSKLNNIRNNRTFFCSLAVLVVGAILFATVENATIIIGSMAAGFAVIGLICSILYVYKVKEVPLSKGAIQCRANIRQAILRLSNNRSTNTNEQIGQGSEIQYTQYQVLMVWLKKWDFYMFALFYLSTRVYINVCGTLLPFLIVDVLQFGDPTRDMPVWITINSLIITSLQILTCILMPYITRFGHPLAIFTVVSFLSFTLGFLMLLLTPQVKYLIFMFSIFIGCFQAILLNLSIDLMNQVIGDYVSSGGMLIGIYGLLDKCSSGLVIFFVTSLPQFETSLTYKRFSVCIAPVAALGLSGIIGCIKIYQQYQKNKKQHQNYTKFNQEELPKEIPILRTKPSNYADIAEIQNDMIL